MADTTTPKPETDGATERPWKPFHQGSLISIYRIYRNGVDDIIHWTGFDAAHSRGKVTLANAKLIIESVNSHDTLKSENARLREQVKELRSALKPFARMASDIHEAAPDNALCVVATLNGGIMSNKEFCTVSDLRRARDLMEKTNG